VSNHGPLPIPADVRKAAKHAFATVENRWRDNTTDATLLKRFPYLLDPLGGLLNHKKEFEGGVDQLHEFMEARTPPRPGQQPFLYPAV